MTWWHYLLLANVYLTLFFVFYTLFLSRETFFNLNRVYLVSSALLSFFIPVIQSDWIKNLFITQKMHDTIYHVSPSVIYQFNATASPERQLTMGEVFVTIYLTGILILTVRFIYQLAVINWAINQRGTDTTYSFFNQIKVEEHDADNEFITAHEYAHARQWHTADILLLEAIMIINWFNPVVYFYRTAVKHIHEFIADRDALKAGTDKAEYAMLLLSQTFTAPPYDLVNPFFTHSLLKKRIQMLQKSKSQHIMLIKYGLSAPLFALMLVLSSATVNNSKTIKVINHKAQEVFLSPASFSSDESGNSGEIIYSKTDPFASGPDSLSEQDRRDLYAAIRQHQMPIPATTLNPPAKKEDAAPAPKIARDQNEIFTAVEYSAEFPGGIEAFYKYLNENLTYPEEARKNNIQGRVYVTFVVEKDGSITDVKVLRGIGGGADEESVKLLSTMPKWRPGIQNGFVVRQQYTVPIKFTLTDPTVSTTPASAPKDLNPSPVNDSRQADPASTSNSFNNGHNVLFTAVEHSAEYPGGLNSLYRFLSRTIHYPSEARERNIQGKVSLTFIVETDGSLTNIRVLHDPGYGMGAEAVRAISQSPKWKPGEQNGRAVRQQYTMPISFSLNDTKLSSTKAKPSANQQLAANSLFKAQTSLLQLN